MSVRSQDQAAELRSLIRQTYGSNSASTAETGRKSARARTITVTSGKGGVGKSLLALNLSIALARAGRKVCLLDADLGLGNLDMLCGLNGYWNLSHVLTRSRSLREVMLQGPEGIAIIPGASGLMELADLRSAGRDQLLAELAALDTEFDELIIDCGTGIHRGVRQFAQAADTVLLVTTLETTSLADTYAAFKVFQGADIPDVRLIFNRADTGQAQQAIQNIRRTVRQFLQTDISILGCIPDEPLLAASVSRRVPFLLEATETDARQAFQHLARMLSEQNQPLSPRAETPFITRLQTGPLSAA